MPRTTRKAELEAQRKAYETEQRARRAERAVRLQRARLAAGLKIRDVQQRLAEQGCVLNFATVYRYLTGATAPSLGFLETFAQVVTDSPHRLAFGDEPSPALAAAWLERELDRELMRRHLDRQERFAALMLGRVKGQWLLDVLRSPPVLKVAADALQADYRAMREWLERVGGPSGGDDHWRRLQVIAKALSAGQGPANATEFEQLMANSPKPPAKASQQQSHPPRKPGK